MLGASRELTGRYLLPATARLHAVGLLDDEVTILGVDRHDHNDDAFRAFATERLARHAPDLPPSGRGRVHPAAAAPRGGCDRSRQCVAVTV